ncbi:MAG TPA: hypothetical protein VFO10_18220 [Oligoflexus sp.]|uniref:hypothetical protein n=1 Tax=Oligoflexus sp. TaxID=1971216 RepID=UPI002D7E50B4|nr:hypothetical protein [Oligoflexus sp.]HET9239202.1 hypothetical protein [Oligoflexus sp.]
MKNTFLVILIAGFTGCVTTKPIVPELAGKPRVKINDQPQNLAIDEPLDAAPAENHAPDNKDTKGSTKHVRKKSKAGNTKH